MLTNVEGCKEAYQELANLVPKNCEKLLDLGCGTGLELEQIYKVLPEVAVTGIDLTPAMLEKLKKKFQEKEITLVCGSYFDVDYGLSTYDCVISMQTMHHFSHEKKVGLYKRIVDSLKDGGVYIECDYMVKEQEEEEFYYSENKRIRKELGIPENEFYHYDTPCTIENQLNMFLEAGFYRSEKVFRIENTTIIVSYK